jgi:hypothetical protein
MNDEPQAAPAPATPPQPPRPPHAYPFIPIKVIDAREPNAPLATLFLNAVPRPGDRIMIDLAGRRVIYKVDFVSFEPYDATAHVTLGCSPNQPTAAVQSDPAKVNEFIQAQQQSFQKAEAYSKTIIGLGYVGLFAISSFVKDHLSHRAVLWTAMLAGFSLIVFIAWEIWLMIWRTRLQDRFNRAIRDRPADPAKAINDYVEQMRNDEIRGTRVWRVIQILTVFPGFAAAFILMCNVLAELWP